MEKIANKHTVEITGGLWEAFKLYKKDHPESSIDRKTYVETCKLINKTISNKIITESFEFRVPYRLGSLRIKTNKQTIKFTDGKLDTRKNPINWNATVSLWKETYPDMSMDEIKKIPNKKIIIHVNEHSNGYIMRWYWDKRVCNISNNSAYAFKPVKGPVTEEGCTNDGYFYGRLGLSKWIKSEDRINEYYE